MGWVVTRARCLRSGAVPGAVASLEVRDRVLVAACWDWEALLQRGAGWVAEGPGF